MFFIGKNFSQYSNILICSSNCFELYALKSKAVILFVSFVKEGPAINTSF